MVISAFIPGGHQHTNSTGPRLPGLDQRQCGYAHSTDSAFNLSILATVLLCIGFCRLVSNHRTFPGNVLYRRLDLVLSISMFIFLAVPVGLRWSNTNETGLSFLIPCTVMWLLTLLGRGTHFDRNDQHIPTFTGGMIRQDASS